MTGYTVSGVMRLALVGKEEKTKLDRLRERCRQYKDEGCYDPGRAMTDILDIMEMLDQ